MNEKKYGHWQRLIAVFLEKNKQINLSAIRTPDGVYKKHILDSLELIKVLGKSQDAYFKSLFDQPSVRLLDVWTGGGFPLIPLALSFSQISCFGIDARRKKIHAVQDIVQTLGIPNIQLIRWRIEQHQQKYSIVTARGVAYADKLFRWIYPLLEKWGYMILRKLFTQEEDDMILGLIRQYDMTLTALHHYVLEDDDVERVVYVIQNRTKN